MADRFDLELTFADKRELTFSLISTNGAHAYDEGEDFLRWYRRRNPERKIVKAQVVRLREQGVQIIPIEVDE